MVRKKPERISLYPKELEGKSDGEDWISRLPNEIIVHILSKLTVGEAMKTNALSRRWRHMWTFMSCLDLDAQKSLDEAEITRHPQKVEPSRYVKWVNQVLAAHQADTVDQLRIRYDLYWPEKSSQIERWFHCAIEKRVKRFELDLSSYDGYPQPGYFRYALNMPPSHPIGFPGYETLKDLQLSSVNASGEFLESILSICPMLERLCVISSESLVELNVPSLSLCLKYLVIRDCSHMEKVEIHAENLMSLTYCGPNISLPLKNLPCLTELYVGGGYCEFLIDNIPLFSSKISQLQALGLDMHRIKKTTDFLHFPVLSHLKKLEVKLDACVEESLIGLTSVIKASPNLHKFALWLYCKPEGDREVQEVEKCCHENLKEVEFFGFVGRALDMELATYFIENAKVLEKMIIDRREVELIGRALQYKETRMKISARKHAKLWRTTCNHNSLKLLSLW